MYRDMVSWETNVPHRGLGDVLQSTVKEKIKDWMRPYDEMEALEASRSLMRLWKEGMENAEEKEDMLEREKDKGKSGLRRLSGQMKRREKDEEDETWGHGH